MQLHKNDSKIFFSSHSNSNFRIAKSFLNHLKSNLFMSTFSPRPKFKKVNRVDFQQVVRFSMIMLWLIHHFFCIFIERFFGISFTFTLTRISTHLTKLSPSPQDLNQISPQMSVIPISHWAWFYQNFSHAVISPFHSFTLTYFHPI